MDADQIWQEWIKDHRDTHKEQDQCLTGIKVTLAKLEERYKGWRVILMGIFSAVPGVAALIVLLIRLRG